MEDVASPFARWMNPTSDRVELEGCVHLRRGAENSSITLALATCFNMGLCYMEDTISPLLRKYAIVAANSTTAAAEDPHTT